MPIPKLYTFFQNVSRDAGWTSVVLGSKGVYLAQAKYVGTRPQVTRCAFYPLEEVNSSALEKLRKEAQLEKARITTLLGANEYQLLMVEAPNVPVDELKASIRWKIKDSLNYHVDDATVDVLQIPSGKYGSERPQALYAVAASNETIRKRINLFDKARMELSVIDIAETAQRNIAALYETEGRGWRCLRSTTMADCLPSPAMASCSLPAASISRSGSCPMPTSRCASNTATASSWKYSVRWIILTASSIRSRSIAC